MHPGDEDNPGYELIVHPPVGKQLIAVGEWIFGYNGWGWRFTAAICGALMIFLVIRIARRLTRSTLLGGIAGILLICDGVSHVQSRMGMLDIFIAFFVNRLSHAVISPDMPAWRLIPIEPRPGRLLVWLMTVMAVVVGFDYLMGVISETRMYCPKKNKLTGFFASSGRARSSV